MIELDMDLNVFRHCGTWRFRVILDSGVLLAPCVPGETRQTSKEAHDWAIECIKEMPGPVTLWLERASCGWRWSINYAHAGSRMCLAPIEPTYYNEKISEYEANRCADILGMKIVNTRHGGGGYGHTN